MHEPLLLTPHHPSFRGSFRISESCSYKKVGAVPATRMQACAKWGAQRARHFIVKVGSDHPCFNFRLLCSMKVQTDRRFPRVHLISSQARPSSNAKMVTCSESLRKDKPTDRSECFKSFACLQCCRWCLSHVFLAYASFLRSRHK